MSPSATAVTLKMTCFIGSPPSRHAALAWIFGALPVAYPRHQSIGRSARIVTPPREISRDPSIIGHRTVAQPNLRPHKLHLGRSEERRVGKRVDRRGSRSEKRK